MVRAKGTEGKGFKGGVQMVPDPQLIFGEQNVTLPLRVLQLILRNCRAVSVSLPL